MDGVNATFLYTVQFHIDALLVLHGLASPPLQLINFFFQCGLGQFVIEFNENEKTEYAKCNKYSSSNAFSLPR